jgi:hypothetical protein
VTSFIEERGKATLYYKNSSHSLQETELSTNVIISFGGGVFHIRGPFKKESKLIMRSWIIWNLDDTL